MSATPVKRIPVGGVTRTHLVAHVTAGGREFTVETAPQEDTAGGYSFRAGSAAHDELVKTVARRVRDSAQLLGDYSPQPYTVRVEQVSVEDTTILERRTATTHLAEHTLRT